MFGRGDRALVDAMLAALRHRGPDDGHAVATERFALGARRLSIIDVEGGRHRSRTRTARSGRSRMASCTTTRRFVRV